jgi:LacI family transcriptional regulator
VARLAGVAASSVSRVLNDHPDVSASMRERVLHAAEKLSYEPDFVAQSLRRGVTNSVGFIVRDISNPLFADIVKGAEQELEKHGYSILLMNSLGDATRDANHLRVLRQRKVDGLILSLQSETHPDTIAALHEASAPIVLVDRDVPDIKASAVLSDHFSGVFAAAESLIRLGHRRVDLIGGPPDVRASRDRRRGFERARREGKLAKRDFRVRFGPYTHEFGYDTLNALLDGKDPPTAVLGSGVQVGSGILRALGDRALSPGADLSVIVCDEVEFLRLMRPSISVIARDGEAIGIAAAKLLVERMRNADEPVRTEVLPTVYVARDSSAPPPSLS